MHSFTYLKNYKDSSGKYYQNSKKKNNNNNLVKNIEVLLKKRTKPRTWLWTIQTLLEVKKQKLVECRKKYYKMRKRASL